MMKGVGVAICLRKEGNSKFIEHPSRGYRIRAARHDACLLSRNIAVDHLPLFAMSLRWSQLSLRQVGHSNASVTIHKLDRSASAKYFPAYLHIGKQG